MDEAGSSDGVMTGEKGLLPNVDGAGSPGGGLQVNKD